MNAGHPFLNTTKRILLIAEDDVFRAEVASILDVVRRYETISRKDGASALDVLHESLRVDLILCNGVALTPGSEVGRLALLHGIPVIVLTKNFEEAVNALRIYAMKIPVLKRPISDKNLVMLVDHYLFGSPVESSPVLSAWWSDPSSKKPGK